MPQYLSTLSPYKNEVFLKQRISIVFFKKIKKKKKKKKIKI